MNKRQNTKGDVQAIKLQAQAVAAASMNAPDILDQVHLDSAAYTLERLAHQVARKAEQGSPVLDLPSNASLTEMRAARQRRAVRRGQDVYLPSWAENSIGLPNALLRSALFASTNTNQGMLCDVEIASQGNTSLTFTGERLNSYDRKIFAVCLDHYRGDRALSAGGSSPWVTTTYYAFARALDLPYGANVHRAIRASLLRLNSANLRARVDQLNVSLPRMVEVEFGEGDMKEQIPDEEQKGRNHVVFRVAEEMACLFGPADWTAVPKVALTNYSGLAAWLASFYATHNGPRALPFNDVYTRSGVSCTKAEFRRMLQAGLTKLRDAENPAIRVDRFAITKGEVWVCLDRWQHTGACPLGIDEDI